MISSFQIFKRDLIRHGLEYFSLFYSVYRGIVIDNNDPEGLGRLKISCPSLFGEELPASWAWPKVSYAGNNTGFFAIPEKGDGVYIECEGGNSKYLLWCGGWWAKPDSTSEVPAAAQVSPPSNKVWQTVSGHKIEMDDTDGGEKIKITDKAGSYVLLDSATGKATIKATIIEFDGGSGTPLGCVTGASVCHFIGVGHGDPSLDVKASKGA